METFDLAWFLASIFGIKFPELTQAQYDYAFILAESDLDEVKCWCPLLYPVALQTKIAMLLEGAGLGKLAGVVPSIPVDSGTHIGYVIEDEVYDVRRKYKIIEKPKNEMTASPSGQLQAIMDKCKAPLKMGATLAGGINRLTGGCCGADKSEIFRRNNNYHGY